MKTQKQTINEMIAQIIAEARKLGYSEATIWRNITPKFQTVAVYYEKRGVCFYDPAITRELVDLQKERLDREEISIHYYKRVKSAANRLDEFYLTGTLHLNMPKHGTKYPISEGHEKLIDLFLDHKGYGPNTRDDVVWVVRRYLHYFESLGYASLEWVAVEQVRRCPRTFARGWPRTIPPLPNVRQRWIGWKRSFAPRWTLSNLLYGNKSRTTLPRWTAWQGRR